MECGGSAVIGIDRAEAEFVTQCSGAEGHIAEMIVVGQILEHFRVTAVEELQTNEIQR